MSELAAHVRALQAALDAAGVALQVVSGGEVDVLWAQNASDDDLRAASYGARGTDLLVETPYGELPPIFEDLLFKIRVRGFRVLLAHPERNRSFQQDPARLLRLVDGDVLVQVTAASVVGGGRAGKLAQRLIADGHAHVIAGDLHRAGGSRASLREAVAAVGPRARRVDGHAGPGRDPRRPPAPPAAAGRRSRAGAAGSAAADRSGSSSPVTWSASPMPSPTGSPSSPPSSAPAGGEAMLLVTDLRPRRRRLHRRRAAVGRLVGTLAAIECPLP